MDELLSYIQDTIYKDINEASLRDQDSQLEKIILSTSNGSQAASLELYSAKFDSVFTFLCQSEEVPIQNVHLIIKWILEVSERALFPDENSYENLNNRDFMIQILENFMAKSEGKTIGFEENKTKASVILAKIHESNEEWIEAAKSLSRIPFENNRYIPILILYFN